MIPTAPQQHRERLLAPVALGSTAAWNNNGDWPVTLDLHSSRIARMAAGPIHWLPSAGGQKGFAVWHAVVHDCPAEIWIALPALSAATGQALGADENRIRAVLFEYNAEIEERARHKARPGQKVIILDDAELSSVDWKRRNH